MTPVLQVEKLGHCYSSNGKPLEVLQDVSFELFPSEMIAVEGESGCGKTTLLLACGAMQRPTAGVVKILRQDVFELPAASRIRYRASQIGYLFQTLQLIPYLNVLDNVRMVKGVSLETAKRWLVQLGLEGRMTHQPDALSHGQRQRVALARAIVHRPALVIADEPTGNLDPANKQLVFQTLRQFADEGGSVLIATHDPTIAEFANRVLRFEAGSFSAEVQGSRVSGA